MCGYCAPCACRRHGARGRGRGRGGGAGGGAAAGGVLAVELCAPLLLLCWLCCWPDDASSGYKKPLSAHRSHEEIGGRRKLSSHEPGEAEARYHSAPSVIDEVLHRRDWERSTKDLYIPLRPEPGPTEAGDSPNENSDSLAEASPSPQAASQSPASGRPCKKHHSNIKSSRRRKESADTDDKDTDATEPGCFYIGEREQDAASLYRAKGDKQTFNESLRSRGCLDDVIEQLDRLQPLDRSGATHHTIESRLSLARSVYPPPSVEPVGYEGGACYLAERGALADLRACALRARHASDGDILAPPLRPESGAFSESDLDLDLDLDAAEERPPPYDELQRYAADHKETAI
ncbi:hypothetical protein HF086_000788 [Spodoptera exigua]|uniref:Uncharacterized protein n=1 Tax=Spodoptera exigua TaxID=7107 RepID=A0A922MQR3_SPOEX|nr:hypothetical protein HF086_000788 [Spodoptera exigua]